MDVKSMNFKNFQTEQEKFWSQEFGDEYTNRNQLSTLNISSQPIF